MNTLESRATTPSHITRLCSRTFSPLSTLSTCAQVGGRPLTFSPSNTHILNGNAEDLYAECEEYEAKIRGVGGIDLFLGGIGADGHIAFNEVGPGTATGANRSAWIITCLPDEDQDTGIRDHP